MSYTYEMAMADRARDFKARRPRTSRGSEHRTPYARSVRALKRDAKLVGRSLRAHARKLANRAQSDLQEVAQSWLNGKGIKWLKK